MADNRESIWWCKFLLLTTFMKTIEVFLTFFVTLFPGFLIKNFLRKIWITLFPVLIFYFHRMTICSHKATN